MIFTHRALGELPEAYSPAFVMVEWNPGRSVVRVTGAPQNMAELEDMRILQCAPWKEALPANPSDATLDVLVVLACVAHWARLRASDAPEDETAELLRELAKEGKIAWRGHPMNKGDD